ncbi:MAG: NAD(P)/FAD-dependent oxidoreductase [Thermoflexibacter sp.]
MAVRMSDTRSRGIAIEESTEALHEVHAQSNVIVVGAGVAGMYAAYLLHNQGFEVTILEASAQWGGRVRALEGFASFPVEIGAEEIHGENSLYYQIVRQANVEMFDSEGGENLYLVNDELLSEERINENKHYKKALDLIEKIVNYDGEDISLQEYMDKQKIDKSIQHILNAELANERGTSSSRLSMKGLAYEFQHWKAGYQTFMLKNHSHSAILKNYFASILDKIQYNQEVKAIDYSEDLVSIITQSGQSFQASKVVLTVPLTILKANLINFYPVLPKEKELAIQKIGMGAGMKVILKFKQAFWGEHTNSIFGQLVPEYWVTSFQRNENEYVLTALVNGVNAEFLSHQGEEAINSILNELDNIFGANVASANLEKSYLMDWIKEPFIKGAYSFDKVGGGDSRQILAEPIAGKLFFAGEATCTNGHHASIHGAMESAARAVKEILETNL